MIRGLLLMAFPLVSLWSNSSFTSMTGKDAHESGFYHAIHCTVKSLNATSTFVVLRCRRMLVVGGHAVREALHARVLPQSGQAGCGWGESLGEWGRGRSLGDLRNIWYDG